MVKKKRFRSWRELPWGSHVSNGRELGSATEMDGFVGGPGVVTAASGRMEMLGWTKSCEVEVQISVGMAPATLGSVRAFLAATAWRDFGREHLHA